MERYSNNEILKNINHISELKNIIIEGDNVFFAVSTVSGDNRVLLLKDELFIILDDSSGDELFSGDINSNPAKDVMSDIATLILKDFGNIKDIKENIKILSEEEDEEEIKLLFRDETRDEEEIKLLFRDERLEFEFIILFGNKNISIFNPENGKEIVTSEYNLDMARIVMMNIFLSSFRPDVPHIFYYYIEEEFYFRKIIKKIIDLATPILSAIDYNLIMDDFITYFYRLEGFVNRDNIGNLTRSFARSGWTGALKFILDNTPESVIIGNNNDNIMYIGNNVVHGIISYMTESNNQEMFDFVFDEFMPRYGYNNKTNYINLAFLIVGRKSLEQFKYLVYKLPGDLDVTKNGNAFFNFNLIHSAIRWAPDIAKYIISNYDIDPNDGFFDDTYIKASIESDNIEIFKLLISKDGLIISGEDRELIESRAEYNEEIRVAYEEYLKRNGLEYAINNFDPNKGYFTIM